MTRHIGLVDPSSRQIQSGGQLAHRLLQARAAAGLKALAGHPLEHDILHASFTAQAALFLAVTVLVDHQTIGAHNIKGGQEVQITVAPIDVGLLDISYGAHHEQAFLLTVHCLVPLEMLDGLVTANAHVQVSIL